MKTYTTQEQDRLQTQIRAVNTLVASLRGLLNDAPGLIRSQIVERLEGFLTSYNDAIKPPKPITLTPMIMLALFDKVFAEYEEEMSHLEVGDYHPSFYDWIQRELARAVNVEQPARVQSVGQRARPWVERADENYYRPKTPVSPTPAPAPGCCENSHYSE